MSSGIEMGNFDSDDCELEDENDSDPQPAPARLLGRREVVHSITPFLYNLLTFDSEALFHITTFW